MNTQHQKLVKKRVFDLPVYSKVTLIFYNSASSNQEEEIKKSTFSNCSISGAITELVKRHGVGNVILCSHRKSIIVK